MPRRPASQAAQASAIADVSSAMMRSHLHGRALAHGPRPSRSGVSVGFGVRLEKFLSQAMAQGICLEFCRLSHGCRGLRRDGGHRHHPIITIILLFSYSVCLSLRRPPRWGAAGPHRRRSRRRGRRSRARLGNDNGDDDDDDDDCFENRVSPSDPKQNRGGRRGDRRFSVFFTFFLPKLWHSDADGTDIMERLGISHPTANGNFSARHSGGRLPCRRILRPLPW